MNHKPETFYSNGKLLLTGEYLVLDGALALALPTKLGQSLKVESIAENKCIWNSLDENGNKWFEEAYPFSEIVFPFVYECSIIFQDKSRLNEVGRTLLKILFCANQLNKSFLSHYIDGEKGIKITTHLDFPRQWGLGTSSTLVNNIANWAKVDAYELLAKTFGGSGYDIACAKSDSAISYQLIHGKSVVKEVDFNPPFKENLYFIYLNKKQNSREGIAQYKQNSSNLSKEIASINSITNQIVKCDALADFEDLINQHEQIISKIIGQKTIQQQLFPDFKGSIKSLGAWGGDFVLVASAENPANYFKSKGFETILKFRDLIK